MELQLAGSRPRGLAVVCVNRLWVGLAHPFEEPQLLSWKRQPHLTRRRRLAIDHQGFVRREGDQCILAFPYRDFSQATQGIPADTS